MRVLITGADKPLGRELVEALVTHRPDLSPVVLGRRGYYPDGVDQIVADPLLPDRYGEAIHEVEGLINLIDYTAENPQVWHRNLKATQALLHAFTAYARPRWALQLSTALLADPDPVDPDVGEGRYQSVYLATRAAIEARVVRCQRLSGVPMVIVRAGIHEAPPLSRWLVEIRAALAQDRAPHIPGQHIDLPWVRRAALVEALLQRIPPTALAMPGEREVLPGLSRVLAVDGLFPLARLYGAACAAAHRQPQAEIGLRQRLTQVWQQGGFAPVASPSFLRRPPVREINAAWVEKYGATGTAVLMDLYRELPADPADEDC